MSQRQGLVALHGFSGQPADWQPVIERLGSEVELHAPALLGHEPATISGPDKASPAPFEDEVDRLAAWLAEKTESPAHLAGYSMGGRLAIGLLARHPERFRSATLIGVHPGLESRQARRARQESDEALARRLLLEGIEPFVDFWQTLPLFASQQRLEPAELEAQRRRRLAHDPRGLARALRHLGPGKMPDYWSWLPSIAHPITLLVGEDDTKFRRLAERMVAALPDARHLVVPDAGHNLLLEAPEAVARALQEDLS